MDVKNFKNKNEVNVKIEAVLVLQPGERVSFLEVRLTLVPSQHLLST